MASPHLRRQSPVIDRGRSTRRRPTAGGRRPSGQSTRIDVCLLVVPLGFAIVNPGTGILSGHYASIAVTIFILLRYGAAHRFFLVDLVAFCAGGFVLLSPLWAFDWDASASPSRGAAAVLFYFVTVRIVVSDARRFAWLVRSIVVVCAIYAAYFAVTARALDSMTSRVSVEFANANYSGVILAFGAVASLWVALHDAPIPPKLRGLSAIAGVLQSWAVLLTGSRASFAGLLAGLAVIGLCHRPWRAVRIATLVLVVVGFVIGFAPSSASIFLAVSQSVTPFSTFQRGAQTLGDLSGREEIWASTRTIASENWLLGAGPEGYRLLGGSQILAHAWGLDYVASVGLLGASLLASVVLMSFLCKGVGATGAISRPAVLWTCGTALVLLPSLVLASIQWTLWAWVGFALWSKAHLLDGGAGEKEIDAKLIHA